MSGHVLKKQKTFLGKFKKGDQLMCFVLGFSNFISMWTYLLVHGNNGKMRWFCSSPIVILTHWDNGAFTSAAIIPMFWWTMAEKCDEAAEEKGEWFCSFSFPLYEKKKQEVVLLFSICFFFLMFFSSHHKLAILSGYFIFGLLAQTANQPITWEQPYAFRHIDLLHENIRMCRKRGWSDLRGRKYPG